MMRNKLTALFFVAIAGLALSGPRPLIAQSCQDEEAMVQDSKKTIVDFVVAVKKESLQDFENKFHQKTCVSNLTFAVGLVGELLSCLDKATQDTALAKDQAESYKTKRDGYAKLKDKLDQTKNTLKATAAPKDAKALVEKLDFSN